MAKGARLVANGPNVLGTVGHTLSKREWMPIGSDLKIVRAGKSIMIKEGESSFVLGSPLEGLSLISPISEER